MAKKTRKAARPGSDDDRTINALAEDTMHRGDYLAPHPSHAPTTPEAARHRARQVAGAAPGQDTVPSRSLSAVTGADTDLPPGFSRTSARNAKR